MRRPSQSGPSTGAGEVARLEALERRMHEVIEEQAAALLAALEGGLQDVRSDVSASAGETAARMAALETHVHDLSGGDEAAVTRDVLDQRLEHVSELSARAADAGDQRLQGLQEEVQLAVETQRSVLHLVRARLAELTAAVDAGSDRSEHLAGEYDELRTRVADLATPDERVGALEERVGEARAEMSELSVLQTALDGGLGELRAEIAALREHLEGTDRPRPAGVADEPAMDPAGRIDRLERRVEQLGRQLARLSDPRLYRTSRGATLQQPADR